MIVSEIKLYELLKAKIGTLEAEAFVEILEKKVDQKFDDAKQFLATKEDLANMKAEIINWNFIFWIGQLAASIAIAKFSLGNKVVLRQFVSVISSQKH